VTDGWRLSNKFMKMRLRRSDEYSIKIRRSGKRRLADMDRGEETLGEEMHALPVVAIDSFV